MMKIIAILLHKLRNVEHFQFMTDFKNLVAMVTAVAIKSEEEATKFNEVFIKLDEELRVDQGSVLTEKLHVQDSLRDSTWSALNERIKATLMCPFDDEVEAAKRLKRVFDLYGNIRKLSFNEETAAISNLVDDLEKTQNANFCTTIGITPWVNALKTENIEFKDLQNQRDTESANKNSGNVKAVRLLIDPVYKKIVNNVNAMATLNMATPEIEDFVKEVNQKIKYYENTLAARAGRKDSGEDEPPIPEEEG